MDWRTSELSVLQAVRLKGRISGWDLAATLGEDSGQVAATSAQLVSAGLLVEGETLRISREGRERLKALLAEERSGIDESAFAKSYGEFRSVNNEFKAVVSDWQVKNGQPNDHDDAEYDAAVLMRLDGVHRKVLPVIASVTKLLPRLSRYAKKLDSALARVKAGETVWLARPLVDSYHTVWFELHEELIVAAGLTREAEARAGYAT